jgi:hypothetical protein
MAKIRLHDQASREMRRNHGCNRELEAVSKAARGVGMVTKLFTAAEIGRPLTHFAGA